MSRTDNPVLNLIGVNLAEVVRKYRSGVYANLTLENMPKMMSDKTILNIIQEELSPNFKHIKFMFKDTNNARIVVQTSNTNTSENNTNYKRNCDYHRGKLHPANRGFGIPTNYKTWYSERLGMTVHQFMCEKITCSFSCMLKAIRKSKEYNDMNEHYARVMWDYCYPGQQLPREADDYTLLDINGGSMTIEEYTDTNRSVMIPVSIISCAAARHYASTSG